MQYHYYSRTFEYMTNSQAKDISSNKTIVLIYLLVGGFLITVY